MFFFRKSTSIKYTVLNMEHSAAYSSFYRAHDNIIYYKNEKSGSFQTNENRFLLLNVFKHFLWAKIKRNDTKWNTSNILILNTIQPSLNSDATRRRRLDLLIKKKGQIYKMRFRVQWKRRLRHLEPWGLRRIWASF